MKFEIIYEVIDVINVKFYGMIRLNSRISEISLEAKNIEELILLIDKKIDQLHAIDLKNCIIVVNGVNMCKLKRLKTPLEKGDEVIFLSPASGG